MDGFSGWINGTCTWLMKLAIYNVLWFLFTIIGLGIFGWAPATVALFSVIRKRLTTDKEFSDFKEFFYHYKKSFFQSNIIGILLLLGCISIFYSISSLLYLDQSMMILLGTIFFMISILFGIVAIFIFPVYTHYNTTFQNYIRYSLMIGLANLHYGLYIILILGLMLFLTNMFPGLLLFYTVSAPAYLMMQISLKIFNSIEEKDNNRIGTDSLLNTQQTQ
ncbi:YesL family protein [Evansella sp. AB-rgal1]|uniref:YesL family protein n=1 Tax=Evansella sp. AB-rgal1 TaxID=3242696 RepID=UPI00359DB89B